MAQNKPIEELKEIARSLTNADLQTIVALYGLIVAQDVAIEMFESETPGDLMGDTYPGTALINDAVEFIGDLLNENLIRDAIEDDQLARLFDINLEVQTIVKATPL